MVVIEKKKTGNVWEEYEGVLSGLYAASRNQINGIGVFSECPEVEIDEIISFMKLLPALGIPHDSVVLITPHPTLDSLRVAAESKLSKLILSTRPIPDTAESVQTFRTDDILSTTCPLLHFHIGENVPLSVCGAHNDRMVLVPHHMHRWCITGYRECPHYRIKQDD